MTEETSVMLDIHGYSHDVKKGKFKKFSNSLISPGSTYQIPILIGHWVGTHDNVFGIKRHVLQITSNASFHEHSRKIGDPYLWTLLLPFLLRGR